MTISTVAVRDMARTRTTVRRTLPYPATCESTSHLIVEGSATEMFDVQTRFTEMSAYEYEHEKGSVAPPPGIGVGGPIMMICVLQFPVTLAFLLPSPWVIIVAMKLPS